MTTFTHAPPALLPRLSDAALLLVAIAWGTSYGVAKGALAFYPVLGFLAVRFLLTAVLLAPVCVRATPAQRRDAWRAGLPLGGLLLAIFVCETYGVAHTQASNAAFLISLCVVFTPFAEWALLGWRPAARLFGFAAVSLLGAALLAGGWRLQWGLGDALMLAAAVLRAVTVCATSLLARRHAHAAAHGRAIGRGGCGLPAGGAGARRPAAAAARGRLLGRQPLPRAGLHGVRLLRAELGAQAQRAQPRGAAHGHGARLGRAFRHGLAGRAPQRRGVGGRRADRGGGAVDIAGALASSA
jgi:hypothetical protein